MENPGDSSDYVLAFEGDLGVAVAVVSDSAYAGDREDRSVTVIQPFFNENPSTVEFDHILRGELNSILEKRGGAGRRVIDLVFTTRRSGIRSRRDARDDCSDP